MVVPWQQLKRVLARDPAARGIAGADDSLACYWQGSLQQAAESLARNARAVAVVTGFTVPFEGRYAPETDGPPGALYLARALSALGIEVLLISDALCQRVIESGVAASGLPKGIVNICPFDTDQAVASEAAETAPPSEPASRQWAQALLESDLGRRLTHLIAIERPGPSHTLASLRAQNRDGPAPENQFAAEVPEADRDVCLNMLGQPIDGVTARTHLLFEQAAGHRPDMTTIGIGDGGNEIGMGRIPWERLRLALPIGAPSRAICRVPTDHLLTAGVSNWGGYALGASVCALRGRLDAVTEWNIDAEREMIQRLVAAGAIDGVTRLSEPTVDGLPLETYLQALASIREALGLEP